MNLSWPETWTELLADPSEFRSNVCEYALVLSYEVWNLESVATSMSELYFNIFLFISVQIDNKIQLSRDF